MNLEGLASQIHKVYCQYHLDVRGEEYWTKGNYDLLDEQTKEADRYMARFIQAQLATERQAREKAEKEQNFFRVKYETEGFALAEQYRQLQTALTAANAAKEKAESERNKWRDDALLMNKNRDYWREQFNKAQRQAESERDEWKSSYETAMPLMDNLLDNVRVLKDQLSQAQTDLLSKRESIRQIGEERDMLQDELEDAKADAAALRKEFGEWP